MKRTKQILNHGHSSVRALRPSLNLAIISFLLLVTGCSDLEVHPSSALPAREGVFEEETKLLLDIDPGLCPSTKASSWSLIKRLDIFVFDDDQIAELDSYSTFYGYASDGIAASSSGGDKLVAVIANFPFKDDIASDIGCLEDLRKISSDLCSDNPDTPVMSGTGRFRGGEDRYCLVGLSPLMSRVELRELCFEASGIRLTEVKVYLTGISSRAGILQEKDFIPSEILNFGELSEKDLVRLPYSGIVYRYLGNGTRNSGKTLFGPATLYCYPNEAGSESIGSPFTRIVVEGKLDGETRFWSVAVNRETTVDSAALPISQQAADPPGISRNTCYSYSITIRTPGSPN